MHKCHFSSAVLMCHAPIVIPEIAESRADICSDSSKSMHEIAKFLVCQKTDLLVVLSPHAPRFKHEFGLMHGDLHVGNFAKFGRSDLHFEFAGDLALQQELLALALKKSVELRFINSSELDHGALVPLYFLHKANYQGKVLVLGFPYDASSKNNINLGQLLDDFVKLHPNLNCALLASGDMSHKLLPGAPAGFHPHAARFDRLVVKCVQTGKLSQISAIALDLRELAAEDVVDSLEVAYGAVGDSDMSSKFMSYEAPFGVGYLMAILHDKTKENAYDV